jgi:phosphinothricin acetyltransferase
VAAELALRCRDATPEDAPVLLEIYRPAIEGSVISFETVTPSTEEFAQRIESCNRTHAWLVAENAGELAGYAYGTPHRTRDAYRFSTEVSVYVDAAHRGRGIGRQLYEALFERLAGRGVFPAYAAITLPNIASVALHERVGFRHVGTLPRVGFKLGAWRDVGWWYRPLREDTPT